VSLESSTTQTAQRPFLSFPYSRFGWGSSGSLATAPAGGNIGARKMGWAGTSTPSINLVMGTGSEARRTRRLRKAGGVARRAAVDNEDKLDQEDGEEEERRDEVKKLGLGSSTGFGTRFARVFGPRGAHEASSTLKKRRDATSMILSTPELFTPSHRRTQSDPEKSHVDPNCQADQTVLDTAGSIVAAQVAELKEENSTVTFPTFEFAVEDQGSEMMMSIVNELREAFTCHCIGDGVDKDFGDGEEMILVEGTVMDAGKHSEPSSRDSMAEDEEEQVPLMSCHRDRTSSCASTRATTPSEYSLEPEQPCTPEEAITWSSPPVLPAKSPLRASHNGLLQSLKSLRERVASVSSATTSTSDLKRREESPVRSQIHGRDSGLELCQVVLAGLRLPGDDNSISQRRVHSLYFSETDSNIQ